MAKPVKYVGDIEEAEKMARKSGWTARDFLPLMIELDDVRIGKDQAKVKLRREIDNARSAAAKLTNIPTCNEGELIRNLRTIYITHGTADAISDFFSKDGDARNLKRESSELLDLGDDIRYRFLKECRCQKKE